MNLNKLKQSWPLLATLILGLAFLLVNKFDFSFSDFVADKVIQKLNADYSPYGPTDPINKLTK